ncbi:MAG: aminotransferase class I/II-fold pyridoxal phosphate-dependent enzyme [Clostridia bacterium]|nr:aminotransferase class I/II-fold pyridoxal phosphate-dependent enzyme [Clostridia bacterium]
MISTKLKEVHSDIRGELYHMALEMERNGERVLKLNTGNPAKFGFKMPESIKGIITGNLDMSTPYCDIKGMTHSREAIKEYHSLKGIEGITTDDVFITNGVSEASHLIISALCSEGDEFLMPSPCYSLWVNMVRLAGGKAVFYDCDEKQEWMPEIESIKNKITNKTKAILIINPNNPTGTVYGNDVLQKIYALAKEKNLIILSDEIYDRLVYNNLPFTSTASIGNDVLTVTFNGLSKSHSVCGLRSGWLVLSGPEDKKKELRSALVTVASIRLCSNALMQLAIPVALKDSAYTDGMINENGRLYIQQKALCAELEKTEGITFVRNKASFYVFPKIDLVKYDFESDRDFSNKLLCEKKILVVPGSGFYANDNSHFRIVGLPEENDLRNAVKSMGELLLKYRK